MTRENLSAWSIDHATFDSLPPEKRLGFLIGYAVLAPSSHNSQPWKFALKDDTVIVSADLDRALPQSDADHRQMYLSVGCALENLLIAADHFGYRAEITRGDDGSQPSWRVALVGEPLPPAERPSDHLIFVIPKRGTNRNKYDQRQPDPAFIARMKSSVGGGLSLHLVDREPLKAQVARVVSDALIEAMDDDGFRRELSGYIRPNITGAMTGMPMYGFGMPTPLSFLAPALLRKVNVNRGTRKQDEALLAKHTPAFIVLSTAADDASAWVAAGRTYERIALEAVRAGMVTAPLAAAIQIGTNHRRLQSLLGTSLRPQMFFRIGYAAKSPKHSPRLPSERVIVK